MSRNWPRIVRPIRPTDCTPHGRDRPSCKGWYLCGRCGERMTVRDHQRGGQRIVPDSRCQRAAIARGEPPCQRVPGRDLDRAIGNVLVEVVTPETIAVTLALQDDLGARAAEAARLRQLQVERAQYETDLAQRRYLRVDPENRLVADVLEAEWHAKLRALAEAREAAEQQRHQEQIRLSATEREAILELPRAFARFGHDPRTPSRERKRVARLLIEDVTVPKAESIIAQIRFKGGATRTLTVPLPPPFTPSRLTPPDTLAVIDRLLTTSTEAEVAVQLNAQAYRPFAGLPFQAMHVSQRRRAHGLKDRLTRLRDAGMRTAAELAARLGVSEQTVWHWYHRGWITGAPIMIEEPFFLPPQTVLPPLVGGGRSPSHRPGRGRRGGARHIPLPPLEDESRDDGPQVVLEPPRRSGPAHRCHGRWPPPSRPPRPRPDAPGPASKRPGSAYTRARCGLHLAELVQIRLRLRDRLAAGQTMANDTARADGPWGRVYGERCDSGGGGVPRRRHAAAG